MVASIAESAEATPAFEEPDGMLDCWVAPDDGFLWDDELEESSSDGPDSALLFAAAHSAVVLEMGLSAAADAEPVFPEFGTVVIEELLPPVGIVVGGVTAEAAGALADESAAGG